MSEVSYKPLIEDFVWSYTKVTSFYSCPYEWFLRYVKGFEIKPQFYLSFGAFFHRNLELYYTNQLTKSELPMNFLLNFSNEVKGERPSERIVSDYISSGVQYLSEFQPIDGKVLGVEERFSTTIDSVKSVGVIDLVCEDNDGIKIIDHKSKKMKPRSKRKKPTLGDMELDEMLRQLYLYSAYVKEKYGEFPKKLCFNSFRVNKLIEEPFDKQAYYDTIAWFKKSTELIADTEDFYPQIDFFYCKYLCGMNDNCCYYSFNDRNRGGVY